MPGMRQIHRRAAAITTLALLASAPAAARGGKPAAPEIVVYAAASLRDVLEEIAPRGEEAAGALLVFNFGASNDLARQIEAGNKADVLFSADESSMDEVARAGLVELGSRRSLLSNRLVVVTPKDTPPDIRSPRDLLGPGVRRVALADPRAVPAGKYARAWLERAGLWSGLEDRILPGLDVRAALASVESGGAEAGVVYRTDAAVSTRVRIVYEVPESEGPSISYPVAALRDRPRLDVARRVVDWLAGPEAAAGFARHGFIVRDRGR